MAGMRAVELPPESASASVWHTPVALISTSTSPARGPSSVTVSIESGLPAPKATAAFTSIASAHALAQVRRNRLARHHDRDDDEEDGPQAVEVEGLHRALQ